jgi:putative DNA primase/helicase
VTASDLSDQDIEFPAPKTRPLTEEEWRLTSDEKRTKSKGENVVPLRKSKEPRILVSRSLADIDMRSIEWLDRPLWQRAAFHVVAGKKGTGKGTYLASLSSRVTRGALFGRPMNVLLLSSEDSDAIDLKPRVVAAGGDVKRIHTINDRVVLPDDIAALEDLALWIGDVGLFAIDPIGNHLGGENTDAEGRVRNAIAPLNDLADELDCLLIGVRHLKKDTQAGALASVLGSTAWIDVPRSVIVMAADDEDELLFHIEVVAGNRGPSGQGRAFRIELVSVEGLLEPVTRAVEIGDSGKSVEMLLGGKRETKSGKARELILEVLAGVPEMESDALDAQVANQANCAARTVRDVRIAMNKEGLLRSIPIRDEYGIVKTWHVARTKAADAAA